MDNMNGNLFWRVIQPVKAGETLWGDYGPKYWEGCQSDTPPLCWALQLLLKAPKLLVTDDDLDAPINTSSFQTTVGAPQDHNLNPPEQSFPVPSCQTRELSRKRNRIADDPDPDPPQMPHNLQEPYMQTNGTVWTDFPEGYTDDSEASTDIGPTHDPAPELTREDIRRLYSILCDLDMRGGRANDWMFRHEHCKYVFPSHLWTELRTAWSDNGRWITCCPDKEHKKEVLTQVRADIRQAEAEAEARGRPRWRSRGMPLHPTLILTF